MIIRYTDGRTIEGVTLSTRENTLRVALSGCDDAAEFVQVNGRWISEECEPVEIEPAWRSSGGRPAVSEADCLCSRELAAHLIHLLLSGTEDQAPVTDLPGGECPIQEAGLLVM